jgi:sugar phosphate isomerase/epimerase
MNFALSTHWNAGRHTDGEALIAEITALGFHHVELGYDTRLDLVPGVKKAVAAGAVKVVSLHNICPVPVGAPRGHPELYTLASPDRREREFAVQHTTRTLQFASEIGARYVVTHAGNVEMDHVSRQLFDLCVAGQQYTDVYEKLRLKLQVQRDKRAPRQIDYLCASLDQLLPVLAETAVKLCIENLPTWESIPTEIELENLLRRYGPHGVGYWHDVGHAQIRENLGFINADRWLRRLQPYLAGMHVHDVAPPATDHVMPPRGQVDFARLKDIGCSDIVRVVEPSQQTPADAIREALAFLNRTWGDGEPNEKDAVNHT